MDPMALSCFFFIDRHLWRLMKEEVMLYLLSFVYTEIVINLIMYFLFI